MCCFFTALMLLGPRFAFLIYWLIAPLRVNLAFADFNFPWLVGILGLVLVPWTTLMYVIVFPLNGWDWIWLGLALMADVASYVGGVQHRRRVPGYPDSDPLQVA
ncbi:hypothetical protein ACFLWA_07350 [Chloroflexota bacterium]